MINIRKLNKFEIGKALTPEQIYTLKYREEITNLYEKLYFDNFNYLIVFNIFTISIITNLILYIYSYPFFIKFFSNYFETTSFVYNFSIIFISWFLMNLIIYLFFLLSYLFYQDSKHKKNQIQIEKDLPEFLDNLVSNLKGGISLEKGLLQSVRKEQVALLREVTSINEKIMIGKTVEESLREFRKRFDSPIINRTFFLVEEGLKGGGNLVDPLEKISENLKRVYTLDEEIKSNSSGFAIIVTFLTIGIAPLLFSLAITLLSFMSDLFTLLSEGNATILPVSQVPVEFKTYLVVFSYAMIVLITLFSSLIVSQLKNEKIYNAIKYLPIYIIISLGMYKIFSTVLLNFFGSII